MRQSATYEHVSTETGPAPSARQGPKRRSSRWARLLAWRAAPVLVVVLMSSSFCFGEIVPAPGNEPPLAASPLFDDFDDTKEYPSVETLRGLLAPVPGEPADIAESRKGDKPIRRISGLFRLNPPWPAQCALRLSLVDPQHFQLHLWLDTRGVTLRYYPEYHQTWAAYGAAREAGKARPDKMSLWATSEDYYRRSGIGTVEVHIVAGRLFLTRGDLTLLSVPLAETPRELYVEGSALVRGLALIESKWTPEPPLVRPALVKTDRPAELPWEFRPAPGAALARTTDGYVELTADERTAAVETLVSLGGPGLYEFTAEVEDADVGTGLCMADSEGTPVCRVGFLRHRETGKKVFNLLAPRANDLEIGFDTNRQPVPYAGKRQWLRLVCGAGVAKLFTSGDGLEWRQPTFHAPFPEGTPVKVGLYCLAASRKRSIRLRSLTVCRLDSLYAGMPETVLAAVPPLPKRLDRIEDWETWAAESRPATIAPTMWWRACVLRTLCGGVKPQVAQPLLSRLQEAVIEESPELSLERVLEFLRDSSLLYAGGPGDSSEALASQARRLGWAAAARGHPAPFSVVSRAMMRWPVWLARRLPVFSDELLRHELFFRVSQDPEESLREFCRRVRYWGRSGGPRQWDDPISAHAEYLVQWACPVLAPQTPGVRRGRRSARPPTYQAANPLVEPIGKESYNTISEIRAAVDGQAWREACQIIASAPHCETLDLVPDAEDPRLLVSFPLAVAAELRDAPELAKTLAEQFGRIARLRLTQAVAAGDEQAVLAVANQFPGAEAAAEAGRWLGDRCLASGRFCEAVGFYRRVIERCSTRPGSAPNAVLSQNLSSLLAETLARRRLAEAMSGQDWGQPVSSAVHFGEISLSAADFERMVQSLRDSRRQAMPLPSEPADLAALRRLAPGRYDLLPWAKIGGNPAKRPPGVPDRALDWMARQTAACVLSNRLVVHTRNELGAWDLGSGQKRWAQQIDSGEQFQRWPLLPMRPVAMGERILVRRLSSDGPELACLEAADGAEVWVSKPEDYVASDPIVVDDRPLALCASHEATGKASLALVEFNAVSGRVRRRVLIGEFRPLPRCPLDCQIARAEDRLIATVAGCVLAFSPAGRVHWIRRQVWVPPPGLEYQNRKEWLEQYHDPLRVADGRVYATQPGVWGVECIELESGRLIWRQGAGTITRLIGHAGNQLILETSDGPVALDPQSGSIRWTRRVPNCLAVRICNQPDSVVCLTEPANRVRRREQAERISLIWYAAESGQPLGRSTLATPGAAAWFVTPLVGIDKRQWLSLGTRESFTQRELFEMVRVADADPP